MLEIKASDRREAAGLVMVAIRWRRSARSWPR